MGRKVNLSSLALFLTIGHICAMTEPTFGDESSLTIAPSSADQIAIDTTAIDVTASTLKGFESIAMSQNPTIAAAVNAIQSAQGQAIQLGLYPNPVLTGGNTQWGGNQTFWLGAVSQEFVVCNKLKLARSAGLMGVRQAEQQLVLIRFQVLSDVRSEFYRALTLQTRVDVLEKMAMIAGQSLQSAERLRQGGEGTLTDELQLRIQYRRATVALENAKSLLVMSKSRLAALTGVPGMKVDRVEGVLDLFLPNYELELVRAGILSANAEVREAELEISRRRFLLQRQLVEPYPNVTVTGAYQYILTEPHNLPFVQASIGLPVWNRNQGNIRTARAELSRANRLLTFTQNDLSARAAEALGRYQAATQLVKEIETNILPAAQQTVQLAQGAYQGGQFNFLQLLQAQRDLVDVNLGYIDAQEQRWQAAIDLAQLLQAEEFPPSEPTTVDAP